MQPALPPYGHLGIEEVQCIARASHRYQVPELLLHAIVSKENGRTGKCVHNKRSNTWDCGLAQINSAWFPYFKKQGVEPWHVVNTSCVNLHASAYILKKYYLRKNNDWAQAVISYNIGPNNWTPERLRIGRNYAQDVIQRWWRLHEHATHIKTNP